MASLLALSRAELEQAKQLAARADRGHWLVLVCGLLVLVLPPEPYFTQVTPYIPAAASYLLAIVALGGQFYTLRKRTEVGELRARGEEGLRRALLMDALGTTQEPFDVADLRQRMSPDAEATAADFEDPNYYASGAQPGAERLYALVQESAFYSTHLFTAAARTAEQLVWASVVGLVLALLVALTAATSGTLGVTIARIAVLAIGGVIAFDYYSQYVAWCRAARVAERVDQRIEKVAQPSLGETAMAIFSDYASATSIAPPIPTSVYARTSAKLKETWKNRKGLP